MQPAGHERVEVLWPSGHRAALDNVPASGIVSVRRGRRVGLRSVGDCWIISVRYISVWGPGV